jgi:hypothetical protein
VFSTEPRKGGEFSRTNDDLVGGLEGGPWPSHSDMSNSNKTCVMELERGVVDLTPMNLMEGSL